MAARLEVSVPDSISSTTPLLLACRYGHAEICQRLLDAGARTDERNDLGDTALHEAAQGGHVAVAGRLMEARADKNRLIRLVEECDRPQRIHMAGRALSGARFLHDDQAVVMTLSQEDFAAVGARPRQVADRELGHLGPVRLRQRRAALGALAA